MLCRAYVKQKQITCNGIGDGVLYTDIVDEPPLIDWQEGPVFIVEPWWLPGISLRLFPWICLSCLEFTSSGPKVLPESKLPSSLAVCKCCESDPWCTCWSWIDRAADSPKIPLASSAAPETYLSNHQPPYWWSIQKHIRSWLKMGKKKNIFFKFQQNNFFLTCMEKNISRHSPQKSSRMNNIDDKTERI